MTEYPPQYPDQNPASGWPPPAEPGPAVPEQRDQSNPPSDQPWHGTEPPTTIAPVPPSAPEPYPASPAYPATPAYPAPASPAGPGAYPASPAYGQATPASPAYGQATPAYPSDPYTAPVDPYPTTPYPPAPAPAGYPYPASPAYGQTSGPPYGQVIQPQVALVVAPPSSGAATASLVLGIVGLVLGWCACGVPSLLAIIFGHVGLRQTRNNAMSGHGMAVAGLVMGYVLIVPTIIVTVLILGYLGVFGAAAATGGTGGY